MAVITVINTNNSGAGSLRDAIARAQPGDTIAFAANLANQTITLTSQLEITPGKNLTIDGAGAANLTISGNNATRILYLNSNQDFPTTLTVRNLTLANGYTAQQGGAIQGEHRASLTVENVTFRNNVADRGGGAIFSAWENNLTVLRSRFDRNSAIAANSEQGAGAIAFISPGRFTVRDSEFTNNRGINGGAINSLNGLLTIENSRFINNDTTAARFATGQPNDFLRGYGGALYTDLANNSITIRNSLFQGNRGLAEGGAAYLFADPEDTVTIESTVFRQNQVSALAGGNGGNGGAIAHVRNSLNSAGFLNLRNLSFVENTASGQGGGLWMNNTRTSINNSTFSGNRVTGTGFSNVGGAMVLYAQTEITNTTIANNFAGWVGGGISAPDNVPVGVKNTIFFNNTAQNGSNNWGIQQHTSRLLTDNGGNIQFPPKRTNNWNDYNATDRIQLVDPRLGSLQESNGVWFHPLLTGSPAINTGVVGAPTIDQLGRTRDSQPDIGAIEFGTTSTTLPTLRINDVSLAEGNSGSRNAVFTVNLSGASTQVVTVNFATANGSGTAGSDYTATTGRLQFNPGELSKTINVAVLGDTIVEPNETFVINLSNPTNAGIADAQGIATMTNDDTTGTTLPRITINDFSVTEGNSGLVNTLFVVRLSSASTGTVTVNFSTANGSAIAGQDYNALTGSLTFRPGETSQRINIGVIGDGAIEPNETFFVNLSNAQGATLGDAQGMGVIRNDDVAATTTALTTQSTPASSGWFMGNLLPNPANPSSSQPLLAQGTASLA